MVPVGAEQAALAFYVTQGASTTISGVPYGDYTIFFIHGEGWDAGQRTFICARSAEQLDQTASYSPGYATRGTATLFPVFGGNTNVTTVDPSTFDKY